jgi:hypothetical protein
MFGIIQEEFEIMQTALGKKLTKEQLFEAMYIRSDSWKQLFQLADSSGEESEDYLSIESLSNPNNDIT